MGKSDLAEVWSFLLSSWRIKIMSTTGDYDFIFVEVIPEHGI